MGVLKLLLGIGVVVFSVTIAFLIGYEEGYTAGRIEGEQKALEMVDGFSPQTILSQTT